MFYFVGVTMLRDEAHSSPVPSSRVNQTFAVSTSALTPRSIRDRSLFPSNGVCFSSVFFFSSVSISALTTRKSRKSVTVVEPWCRICRNKLRVQNERIVFFRLGYSLSCLKRSLESYAQSQQTTVNCKCLFRQRNMSNGTRNVLRERTHQSQRDASVAT